MKHISHRTHVLDLLLSRVARVSCTLRTSCLLRRVHVRAERVCVMIVGVHARDAPIGFRSHTRVHFALHVANKGLADDI
jgi:hypothetical protein